MGRLTERPADTCVAAVRSEHRGGVHIAWGGHVHSYCSHYEVLCRTGSHGAGAYRRPRLLKHVAVVELDLGNGR